MNLDAGAGGAHGARGEHESLLRAVHRARRQRPRRIWPHLTGCQPSVRGRLIALASRGRIQVVVGGVHLMLVLRVEGRCNVAFKKDGTLGSGREERTLCGAGGPSNTSTFRGVRTRLLTSRPGERSADLPAHMGVEIWIGSRGGAALFGSDGILPPGRKKVP